MVRGERGGGRAVRGVLFVCRANRARSPLAAALAWQRVRAGLHSPAQVAVGGTIGTVAGGARRCLVTHAPQSSTATASATAT